MGGVVGLTRQFRNARQFAERAARQSAKHQKIRLGAALRIDGRPAGSTAIPRPNFFFNKADDAARKEAAQGYALAKQLDYDANKSVWLDPAPANNTWAGLFNALDYAGF